MYGVTRVRDSDRVRVWGSIGLEVGIGLVASMLFFLRNTPLQNKWKKAPS